MRSALVVYFSQGGTNGRVAGVIGHSLEGAGFRVELWNLRDGPPPDPRDHDLLGIGTPTYYYRAPFNVTDWVDALPALPGLPAFVFVVHGAYRGSTGNSVRGALARKGAREVGFFHCRGEDFFLGYLKEGWLLSPDHPTSAELERARSFGQGVAARVAGAPYEPPDDDPDVGPLYRLERFLANRTLVRQFYSRLFRVVGRCRAGCDLCVRKCPVGNIRRTDDGRLAWGRDCLLCLSCEMNCPEDAIRSPVSWPLFRPFMIVNTRLARRDPGLDCARVTHRRGTTVRG